VQVLRGVSQAGAGHSIKMQVVKADFGPNDLHFD
jgi:hypothetical protein